MFSIYNEKLNNFFENSNDKTKTLLGYMDA